VRDLHERFDLGHLARVVGHRAQSPLVDGGVKRRVAVRTSNGSLCREVPGRRVLLGRGELRRAAHRGCVTAEGSGHEQSDRPVILLVRVEQRAPDVHQLGRGLRHRVGARVRKEASTFAHDDPCQAGPSACAKQVGTSHQHLRHVVPSCVCHGLPFAFLCDHRASQRVKRRGPGGDVGLGPFAQRGGDHRACPFCWHRERGRRALGCREQIEGVRRDHHEQASSPRPRRLSGPDRRVA
jgi:hypothetical protein